VNEKKKKYMLMTTKETLRQQIGEQVNIGEYNFEVVVQLIYLGGMVTAKGNASSLEINRRIILANRCFYALNKLMKAKSFPKSAKLTLYKSLVFPVLMFGSETSAMSKADENQLGIFERKILRLIFGPICVNGVWRRRFNSELYEMFNEADIVKKIKIQIQMEKLKSCDSDGWVTS
jgi:hypothetical protein